MKENINLLEGPVLPNLTKLALPIMATSLVQMAYNMVDMIWIGRVSSGAVAAVGAAGMYMWLANGLSTLSKIGGQIKVGHSLGAKNVKEAKEYATSAVQLSIIYALLYTLVLLLFAKPFIHFLGLNGRTVIADGITYLRIVSFGILFSFLNQVLTGLFTAMGNSRISFRATAVGLVINMILDPLFIYGYGPIPSLGVAGAAIATVLAQAVVTLLFVAACLKDETLFAGMRILSKPNTKDMKEINKIGLPISIQSMMFTGISMILSRMVASFGDNAVAVQKVGSQIESISWMTAEGFSAAVNSFVAQNHGAKAFKRVKHGYHISMAVVMAWGIFCTVVLIGFPEVIFKVFIPDESILNMGVSYLRILGFSQLFMCMEIATQGAFSGLGKTIPPSVVSITFTTARIPMAFALSATVLGLNGIWWSLTISSIIKGILLVGWFAIFLVRYEKRGVRGA